MRRPVRGGMTHIESTQEGDNCEERMSCPMYVCIDVWLTLNARAPSQFLACCVHNIDSRS